MADPRARKLRKDMTEAERHLWSILRDRQTGGLKFRRQHPIGRYIADFACFEIKLIVEADGGQHNENVDDEKRTAVLRELGWRVVRFWNKDILENLEGVRAKILEVAGTAASS